MTVPVAWWAQDALDAALAEADRAFPLETGGVLLGWRASTTEVVVTHLVGPGSGAVHHRVWFRPDAEWQQEQIDACYVQSGRTVTYLGDWHTHPNGSPVLSRKDLRTLRRISRHADARIARPVMAVFAGGCPEWRLAVGPPPPPGGGRTEPLTVNGY
jgi:integrative and conjugative element protein (TIGR02256 family)